MLYTSKEPPLEIRHLPELKNTVKDENVGYVTFGNTRIIKYMKVTITIQLVFTIFVCLVL